MKPAIKARWIAALRSGEFQQGKASLRLDGDQYCCLGVLCELATQEGVVQRSDGEYWSAYFVPDTLDASDALLPDAVMAWAGLQDPDPLLIDGEKEEHSASYWNDEERLDFAGIADLVERSL